MIAVAAPPSVLADRTLALQIHEQLVETNRANIKRLTVAVNQGEVTLQGRVGSFHEKQIAIQACRFLAGVNQLVDAVEVAAAY